METNKNPSTPCPSGTRTHGTTTGESKNKCCKNCDGCCCGDCNCENCKDCDCCKEEKKCC